VRSCPVLWTASSAGMQMAKVSAAPGLKPDAVGSGGRMLTANFSNLSMRVRVGERD
jgi:hypothetical protein